ncbi:MAG: hypothetical protein Fues2KO_48440 [Fuerstiella sp.]
MDDQSSFRTFHPTQLDEVYCFLKAKLEPDYQVSAAPEAGYFAQHQFCYRICRNGQMLAEMQGNVRDSDLSEVVSTAVQLVSELRSDTKAATELAHSQTNHSRQASHPPPAGRHPSAALKTKVATLPYASRLPPRRNSDRDSFTWFSSGRAAFAFLLEQVVRPRRVYLPTFVCWSLLDVMRARFADTELRLYSVDRNLVCNFPTELNVDDAIVCINYFGHRSALPTDTSATILHDRSHEPLPVAATDPPTPETCSANREAAPRSYTFGSLRKAYRVADGGFVAGEFNPIYESDRHLDGWLRRQAIDWTDLREAENMTDRNWRMSDISGHSLATVLQTDRSKLTTGRRRNHQFLAANFVGGTSLSAFDADEIPLLHNRAFDSTQHRDDLKAFLAKRGFFASVHWPVHEWIRTQADRIDVSGAIWRQDHTFALPIVEDFDEAVMAAVCDASIEFQRAGGQRFPLPVAG